MTLFHAQHREADGGWRQSVHLGKWKHFKNEKEREDHADGWSTMSRRRSKVDIKDPMILRSTVIKGSRLLFIVCERGARPDTQRSWVT